MWVELIVFNNLLSLYQSNNTTAILMKVMKLIIFLLYRKFIHLFLRGTKIWSLIFLIQRLIFDGNLLLHIKIRFIQRISPTLQHCWTGTITWNLLRRFFLVENLKRHCFAPTKICLPLSWKFIYPENRYLLDLFVFQKQYIQEYWLIYPLNQIYS